MSNEIAGQLNSAERQLLAEAVRSGPSKPKMVLEVGTWLGGGSTVHLLKTLEKIGQGQLWGIEADRGIYEQMMENLRRVVPEALPRFTPLFEFSQQVIPR
jgi:predicted O-methyltransferase YrrM